MYKLVYVCLFRISGLRLFLVQNEAAIRLQKKGRSKEGGERTHFLICWVSLVQKAWLGQGLPCCEKLNRGLLLADSNPPCPEEVLRGAHRAGGLPSEICCP